MKYILVLFASIFLVAADAWAVTRIVAPGGTNTNCSTLTTTGFGSIQAAVDCSVSGDTVQLRGGAPYVQNVLIGKDNLTLEAYPGESPQIALNNPDQNIAPIRATASLTGLTIRGLDVTCTSYNGSSGFPVAIQALAGPLVNSLIEKNRIHDCAGGFLGDGNNLTIQKNVIYNVSIKTTSNLDHGIYSFLNNSHILNNLIYNVGGSGSCIQLAGGDNTVIANNTMDCGSTGIFVYRHDVTPVVPTTNAKINNNIFTNNSNVGVEYTYASGASGITMANNLYFNNGTNVSDPFAVHTETAAISGQNPLFVNSAIRDYRLQSTSPARNAGTSVECPTTDLDSFPRSGGCDIGAFEYRAPGPAVTWTNDRGGSGTASGTTNWTTDVPLSGIPFKAGINPITVTATDNTGATTTDTITITYAPTFPGATLALAYGFEEASGTSATDSSTNKNTGTLNNGPTRLIGTGKFGNGISLNGVNQYITANSAASLDFTQSFTFSAYVKPHAAYSDFKALMVKDVTGGNGYVQFLYATVAGFCGSGRALGGFQANGPIVGIGSQFTACDPTTAIPSAWTHLAVTYDNTAQELKLYRNGALVITMPASGYMEPSTGQFRIGASQFAGTLYEFLDADVDEIRAYNVAIPATDGKLNTVFGAACGYSTASVAAAAADRLDMTKVSVMGDANCAVIQPVAPTGPALKIPAAPSGVKVSSGSTMKLSQ